LVGFALVITVLAASALFAQIGEINAIKLKLPAVRQLPALQNDKLKGITALTQVNGQMIGAGSGQLSLIDEKGNITKSILMGIQKVAGLSAYTPGKLLIGDGASNSIMAVDAQSGDSTTLLVMPKVNAQGFPAGSVIGNGELSGVAFDGKNVYVSYRAGLSSSIFKIDPAAKRVLEHGWSPGDDPSALAYSGDKLFVLDAKGGQVRPMAAGLKPTYTWIDIDNKYGKGLIIQDSEIRVLTDSSIQRLVPDQNPSLIAPNTFDMNIPAVIKRDPVIPLSAPVKYAVLICGDVAESGADYNCFWNDTLLMYKMLLAKGFTAQNIYVLYGNGVDHVCDNPTYKYPTKVTDFPATIPWVNRVFDGMKNGDASAGITKVKANDKLFIWTFDHGAGGKPAYLCLMDGWLKDSDFTAKLNAIPYGIRGIFMQQCRSGGFLEAGLQNSTTFMSTACRWNENAYVGGVLCGNHGELYHGTTYTHAEYNYYIISAFSGKDPTGKTVNADVTGDGHVCGSEAFNWEANHDQFAQFNYEHPQCVDADGVWRYKGNATLSGVGLDFVLE